MFFYKKIINLRKKILLILRKQIRAFCDNNCPVADTNKDAAEKSRTWKIQPSLSFFYPFPRNLSVSHELYEKKEKRGKEGLL